MSLALRGFEAKGYRSLKSIAYPMANLDVFVGGNGVGKTNLYRSLELLQAAAANTLTKTLMAEGGMDSAMWAGTRRRNEAVRIVLAASFAGPDARRGGGVFRYEAQIGLPTPTAAAFSREPQVKEEALTYQSSGRVTRLVERRGASVTARGADGRPGEIDMDLLDSETVLGRLDDPAYAELDAVRRSMLQWRFYHGLRTDTDSPLRRPCPAVTTPTLSSDGADLAAVFATLAHIREDTVDLHAAIDAAFPGARLVVPQPEATARFGMVFPEFPQRVFDAAELSDGTLRYLSLMGALLAYRLPPFIALNEPEASLHPNLMRPLGRLIAQAADRTQIWLVTHSEALAEAASEGGGNVRTVVKTDGATWIEGLKRWGAFGDDDDED